MYALPSEPPQKSTCQPLVAQTQVQLHKFAQSALNLWVVAKLKQQLTRLEELPNVAQHLALP